jgi:hypothetical protein
VEVCNLGEEKRKQRENLPVTWLTDFRLTDAILQINSTLRETENARRRQK